MSETTTIESVHLARMEIYINPQRADTFKKYKGNRKFPERISQTRRNSQRRVSPHQLRHYFAIDRLSTGVT